MPRGRGVSKKAASPAADAVAGLVGHVQGNAVVPHQFADPVRLFADPDPGPDEVSFHEPNVDAQYYNTGYYHEHRSEVQPFPPPLPNPPRMDLAQILGPNLLRPIVEGRTLTFTVSGTRAPRAIR